MEAVNFLVPKLQEIFITCGYIYIYIYIQEIFVTCGYIYICVCVSTFLCLDSRSKPRPPQ